MIMDDIKKHNLVFYHLKTLVPEVKSPPANAGDIRDTGLTPGSGRSPGGGARQPIPVFLPGESHGEGSLAGYSP